MTLDSRNAGRCTLSAWPLSSPWLRTSHRPILLVDCIRLPLHHLVPRLISQPIYNARPSSVSERPLEGPVL
jgi:hypothetical protein